MYSDYCPISLFLHDLQEEVVGRPRLLHGKLSVKEGKKGNWFIYPLELDLAAWNRKIKDKDGLHIGEDYFFPLQRKSRGRYPRRWGADSICISRSPA